MFPKKLREFKAERINQKHLGNNVKQLGLKILINGEYGLFANPNFNYFDIRVAELIAAYGRYVLSKMQEIATCNGFDIIGGDIHFSFLRHIVLVIAVPKSMTFQHSFQDAKKSWI